MISSSLKDLSEIAKFEELKMRVVSYQPDIAQNLGSLIRLCACFETPLDVIEPCGFPLSIKALRRAAMDYADVADLTKWPSWDNYQQTGPEGRAVLLTTKGAADLWSFDFAPTDKLILGRESAGVPQEVSDACNIRLRIPISAVTRSLNVTTAGAIVLAEAKRQEQKM
ncbi:MAG: tRNA (cytidine(34)-2'-O)-methyltransferase [Pseudomonadota bacterium]